ncbi:hypothetical protein CBL24_27735, partial [Shigella flexneri]
ELGVILLMFGVGLHFSRQGFDAVKSIAIPGAIAQIAVATAAGYGELGVILLMFGVGLHFSRQGFDAVKSIAIPGAIA